MELSHDENNLSYDNDYMFPGIEEEHLDLDIKNGLKTFSPGILQYRISISYIDFLTEEEKCDREARVISLQKHYFEERKYLAQQHERQRQQQIQKQKKQQEKIKKAKQQKIKREKRIIEIKKQRDKQIDEKIKRKEKIKQRAIEEEQHRIFKERQISIKELEQYARTVQRANEKANRQAVIRRKNLLIEIKKEEAKKQEWLKIAETIVKENNNRTLYKQEKMKEIGCCGLFLYMKKYPETFAHIRKNETFDHTKAILRGKIRHEVALRKYHENIGKIINENNGELPTLQSLKFNNYALYVFVKKYSEEFKNQIIDNVLEQAG